MLAQISLASLITLSAQLTPLSVPNSQIDANNNVVDKPLPARVLTITDMIAEKAHTNGVDVSLAQKIAFCESTNRQFDENGEPLRGIHNAQDIGLFQINEKYHLDKSLELGYDIYTTEGNIDYAMWLLSKEGSRHWNWSKKCWSR